MLRQRPLLYLVAVDPGVYDAVFPVYVTGDDPAERMPSGLWPSDHGGVVSTLELKK